MMFKCLICSVGLYLGASSLQANDRRFTYSYEPEVNPKGELEFEQWVTLRTQRNDHVGQENYNRFDFREEVEYGVTDNYTASLYLNFKNTSYRVPSTGSDESSFDFEGVSLENRYQLLNPALYPVGLTLYLEPRFSGDEAEIEEKIILGQRYGDWKWALNLGHATEWKDNFHQTEGEIEVSAGVGYDLNSNWNVALEVKHDQAIPEYDAWESAAVFVGPTVSYRNENWWAALSVLPQVYGHNFDGNGDGDRALDLEHHERVQVRLLWGIHF